MQCLWIFVCIGTLMQASIPTIDEDVTVYLDEYNLIRHYARDGSKAKADVVMDNPFTETLSCYKSMYKSSSSLVLIFEDLFMSNRDKWAMPPSWIAACTDAARVIKEEHEANLIEDMAVPFTFQVPRYDPTDWAYDERSSDLLSDQRSALVYPQADSKDPDVTMDNTGQPIPDSPDQEHGGVQIRTQPGSSAQKQGGGPAQSRAGRSRKIPSAGSKSRYASSTKPLLRYLTVGEITDHRTVENAWVVEPDGRYGFDVYNITGAVRQLGLTNEQYRGLLVRTRDMCQMLRRDNALTENIRKQFGQAIKPIGKQMLEMYPEEVAECQGQNGAPLWVTVGSYIYDLTGFPFVDNEERDKLIRISKNHITLFAMPQDNLTDDLVGRLSTRRCGNIKCPKTGSRRGLHPFTPRSLRWHDNPSMGVYVAIENIVYDITGYIEDHPGGREVLQKGGGIDQTAQFLLHHPPGCLDGYEHLKVGRLVPEITLEQVGRDQVVVHDCVFDLAGLEQTRPNVYSRLRRLGGTDATPILLNKDSAALADSLSMLNIGEKKNAPRLGNSLLRLFLDEKEAIVAKIRTKKIPEITVGEFQKHDDRDWKEGIWVSVNQDVYNVTDIIRFPQFYRYQIPTFWTGKELRDAELATWLTTEHAARMVARLVPGPPLPEKEQISVEATLEAWSRDGMRKMAATELGPSCVHRAKRFRPDGTGSFEDRA
ncbi:hypothetical protein F4779DRAFT_451025 [Xylariaceae sp. FL0662B]|nr:hypothetical protein F4779DRAFT_451025 [Xylariaceae sp. FL0662B]